MPDLSSGVGGDHEPGRGSGPGIVLYVVAVFASAFLIFLVQPMVGKRILPWFGGVPAVWMLCLAFFQTALFVSYAYAHLLDRLVPARLQPFVHVAAVAAALASLPVLPGEDAIPTGDASPTVDIIRILGVHVTLPFLVLGSTGPLVQAWFARAHPARSPYPLYAVSNVGSLLALVAYPFVLEPWLPLTGTGELWSAGFAVACLAVLGCGLPVMRLTVGSGWRRTLPAPGTPAAIGVVDLLLWLLLPGCAVVLLMGVTNALCLDVASVPFLWILPLATYLVTFIVCFSSDDAYRRTPWVAAAAIAAILVHADALLPERLAGALAPLLEPIQSQIASYSLLLLAACMVMHGELCRSRPPPRSLTTFYLCLSAGGAAGGLIVGIAAPLVFDGYLELGVGIALGAVLLLVACARDRESVLSRHAPRWRLATAAALLTAALLQGGWRASNPAAVATHQERSFFGVLRVFETGGEGAPQRQLFNGTTMHGVQFEREPARRLPTSYFGHPTGLGLALALRPEEESARIGIIGLGIGTLAAYGREGDLVRFYEIDPAVVRIARDDGYFSYLEDSPATVEIVVGDARLELAREQARSELQDFDYLVVDAFSSDSIPVHLLTHEAFEHYAKALSEDGLLAFHVSNRHFDLTRLVARMGFEIGMSNLIVVTSAAPRLLSRRARWVLLAREPERLRQLGSSILRRHRGLGLPAQAIRIQRLEEVELRYLPAWTDDYSDLFGTLRPWL